jgi:D-ribose pyranase
MKKSPLLNTALSETISRMGHGDLLVIGDAGLPIPMGVPRIDLALSQGIPGFIDTLRVVLTELKVERIILAHETGQVSPHILDAIQELLPTVQTEYVSHDEFKQITGKAFAMVRTGEFTPYANIILSAGVVF